MNNEEFVIEIEVNAIWSDFKLKVKICKAIKNG
jgi:hypothetical protein